MLKRSIRFDLNGACVRRTASSGSISSEARALRVIAVAFLLTTLCAGSLLADVFRLKDGRRLEGTIVREIGDLVSIKTDDGIVTVDRHEIVSQRKSQTPFDIFRERQEKLDVDDLAGHLDLAKFCEENALDDEAVRLYKRIIEIDGDHEETRKKLGYVWYAGEWYIDGSAELERKKKEVESVDVSDAAELSPEAASAPPRPRPPVRLPPLPSGAQQLAIKLDEKIDREAPKNPGASYTISTLCRQLDPAISASTSFDPRKTPYVMEVKIRTHFLKEVQFYNMPLTNVYRCSIDIGIGARNDEGGLRRVGTLKFEKDFKLASRVPRERGLESAYHAGIAELNKKLRTMKFFRERGAKPLEEKRGNR